MKYLLMLALISVVSCGRTRVVESLTIWHPHSEEGHDVPLYWPREMFPLNIVYASTFNDDFPRPRGLVENALSQWDDSLDVALFNLQGVVPNKMREKKKNDFVGLPIVDTNRKFGIYKKYDWPDDKSSTLAKTSLIYSGSTLINAEVFFNFDDHVFSTDGSPEHTDFESVLVHELGHLLGLIHDRDPFSVMYPNLPPGERRQANQSDQYVLARHIDASFNPEVSGEDDTRGLVRAVVHTLLIGGTCLEYRDGVFVGSHQMK